MEEEEDWSYPIETTVELEKIETSPFMEQPISEPEINAYMHGTITHVQKEHLNIRFGIGSVSIMIAAASALTLDFAKARSLPSMPLCNSLLVL